MSTPPHERLARFMDQRRLELRMTWAQVAERAGVAAETVRAISRGNNVPRDLTRRRLEKALQWEIGSIDLIWSDGGNPIILAPTAVPGPGTAASELTEIAAGMRELSERAARLAERIDRIDGRPESDDG